MTRISQSLFACVDDTCRPTPI